MTLFDGLADPTQPQGGKARRGHPETSRAAAAAVIPRSGTAREKVLRAIAEFPQTDEQIQDRLSMPANTERPRRVELQEQGWIEAHPDRYARTRSGQNAIVWRLTEQGAERLGATSVQSVTVTGERL